MRRARSRPSIRTQPILPLRPGLPERQTHDYHTPRDDDAVRCAERARRTVIDACQSRHTHEEFLVFFDRIDQQALRSSGHPFDSGQLQHAQASESEERGWASTRAFTFTSRPTSSSWLNLIERFFAEIDAQKNSPRHIPAASGSRRRDSRVHTETQQTSASLHLDATRPRSCVRSSIVLDAFRAPRLGGSRVRSQ